jgi:hypothetical protein
MLKPEMIQVHERRGGVAGHSIVAFQAQHPVRTKDVIFGLQGIHRFILISRDDAVCAKAGLILQHTEYGPVLCSEIG